MTSAEEFEAAIIELAEVVSRLGLLALSFHRLLHDMELHNMAHDAGILKPDFDYRTGMPPKD
jgi:hypothetical protein